MTLADKFGVNAELFQHIDINVLGLSIRASHCLLNAQCKTVGDILELSESELKSIKNMGVKSVEDVLNKIREYLSDISDEDYYTRKRKD